MRRHFAKNPAIVVSATAVAVVLTICTEAGARTPAPPVNVKAYQADQARARGSCPAYVVRVYNLQRVLDPDLTAAERAASLRVVNMVGPGKADVQKPLAMLLADPKTPPPLHRALLEYLLKAGQPGLGAHVVGVLPRLRPTDPLREEVLKWLTAHPTREVLIELVKIWAREPVSGADEPRLRGIVERITGTEWDKALLSAINTPRFFARGSAMEILAARIDRQTLRRAIAATRPKTDAMAAMQTFARLFEYMPSGGADLLAVAILYKTRRSELPRVAMAAKMWAADAGYVFNVRDFHLLSRLGADPLRKKLTRKELFLAVARGVTRRGHVRAASTAASAGGTDSFTRQVDSLSIADMWNLYLLDEMLGRRQVQLALGVMAARDRADKRSAWGGLIAYDGGGAKARLYEPRKGAPPDDTKYLPSRRLASDSRDGICRFRGRFERVYNAANAGPTPAELANAKRNNTYGLILTGVSRDGFAAHYYNPKGIIISLGRFSFGKERGKSGTEPLRR